MNQKKAFPFVIAALILAIAVIVIYVLFMDGTIQFGRGNAGSIDDAIVQLVVRQGKVEKVPVADFNAFVTSADKPVFVDFWADWCPPCRLAAPFVEQLAVEYDGRAHILKVDVDRAAALARQYNAQSIPQFSVFAGGQLIESTAGYADSVQNNLRQMIERQLPSGG